MFGRLLLLVALIIGVFWFLRWFIKTPPRDVVRGLKRGALYGLIAVLVLLAVTGRMNWVFAAAAAAIPLAQRLLGLLKLAPLLRQAQDLFGAGGPAHGPPPPGGGAGAGQTSTIETRFLRLSLDHASGEMQGFVLEGEFEGRPLEQLDLDEQMRLLSECRATDAQSTAVLEAYLDRIHGATWRQRDEAHVDPDASLNSGGPMSKAEAYRILGLEPGAHQDQIREAHRRLMQKIHPDRGGSTFLASLINEAKDLLLG